MKGEEVSTKPDEGLKGKLLCVEEYRDIEERRQEILIRITNLFYILLLDEL